jgi:pimeloyl-ACP methyl ester carboxylesterase
VGDLESLAPYPTQNVDLMKAQVAKNLEAALLGPPPHGVAFVDTKRIMTSVLSAPEYSLADDFGYFKSQLSSLQILIPQIMKIDLTQLGPDFRVPIFFFEGRHDPYARPSLIWSYYQTIKASHKEFVWFESSGHFPFFEENRNVPMTCSRESCLSPLMVASLPSLPIRCLINSCSNRYA